MITLIQFPRAKGSPCLSPYCLKLETWLRISGMEYQNRFVSMPKSSPSGKLPFIEMEDGSKHCDSSEIIQMLSQGDSHPDSWLNTLQQAQVTAFQSLIEDHIGSALVFSRWVDPNYWPDFRAMVFAKLPQPLKIILPPIMHRKVAGRLASREVTIERTDFVYERAKKAMWALDQLLQSHQSPDGYLMGDKPCSLDACAFAFLINILQSRSETRLTLALESMPQLLDYTRRMNQQWFPELAKKAS